ncbi:MAG: 4Fe-4S dicluster domain-containing protein [Candidatus Bathyarchaeia archaeon]
MTETKSKPKKSRTVSPMWKRTVSHIFTKPATTKYPFVKPKLADDFRGKPEWTTKTCNMIDLSGTQREMGFDVQAFLNTNCTVCCRDCPANAIEIVEIDGRKRPQFDLNKCIFCNQCIESCPRNAIKGTNIYELATTDKGSLVLKPTLKEAKKQ